MAFTLHPYNVLCKIFGSKDVVQLRRNIYFIYEASSKNFIGQNISSGSRGEGLELEGSDFYMMGKFKHVRVYESEFHVDRLDNMVNVFMETEEVKLGFTRLRIPMDDNEKKPDYYVLWKMGWVEECEGNSYLSSSLIREHPTSTTTSFKPTTHGPCQMWKVESQESEVLVCFQCKEWISLADPWLCRPRGVWPSNKVIQTIKQSGVLFVPVGCKTSKYEHVEWRISFSVAEKQLVHSFSHVQFLCYAMLKTIVSDVVKKLHGELLCSYFVKTIMFWISEEKEPAFWRKENIVQCYLACLKRLIYCVEYRICMHYFIPEINFFEDRFTDNEQKLLARTLHDVYSREWAGLVHTNTFQKFFIKLNSDILLTSSSVAPIEFVNPSLTFASILFVHEVFLRLLNYSLHYKNTVFVHCLTMPSLLPTMLGEFVNSCNKPLYRKYKTVLSRTVICTNSDCVSGWCILASLFYKLKQYNKCQSIIHHCLHKCTPDKILIDGSPYISISNNIERLLTKDLLFSRICRHFIVQNIIIFCSLHILPSELNVIIDMIKFDRPFGFGALVLFPPVVYLYFLDFLCNHHLKQDRAKTRSFRNLRRTVRERYFTEKKLHSVADLILTVATSMLGSL